MTEKRSSTLLNGENRQKLQSIKRPDVSLPRAKKQVDPILETAGFEGDGSKNINSSADNLGGGERSTMNVKTNLIMSPVNLRSSIKKTKKRGGNGAGSKACCGGGSLEKGGNGCSIM